MSRTMGQWGRAVVCAVAASWLGYGVAVADDAAAKALLQKAIDAIPTAALSAKATLASKTGLVREMDFYRKQTPDGFASYLEVMSPTNLKDTRFLFFERGPQGSAQYMYIPFMKRTIQVRDEARKQQFLGSEFYVSDLIAPDPSKYTFAFAGEETVAGRQCTLVATTPKDATDELYSKIVFAIDPTDAVIVRTQFYDLKGKLLKVWTIEKFERIDGVLTGVEQRVTNVQDNTESTLTLKDVKYKADIPNDRFSKPYLER